MRLKFTLGRKRGEEGEKKLVPVSDLIPGGARIIDRNPHGILYLLEGRLGSLTLREHPLWGGYAPIFTSDRVEEVWVFRDKIVATVKGLGRVSARPPPPESDDLENLITRIIAETGAPLSIRQPRVVAEHAGWRLAIQIKAGGQLFLAGQRIQEVPPLRELVDPLLAARILLLLLRPSLVLVAGPPGSGKTTLLNSIIVEAARLWPHLHIAVVERYKELVVEGGWATRVVADLSDGVRFAMQYLRPDALFVGEVSSKDAWTLVEPARSGVPTISTYHSPNIWKTISSLRDSLRLHLGPSVDEKTVLGYIDVFVMTEKIVTLQGIERRVVAVYVSDGQRLQPIYVEGRHTPPEMFERMLPERLVVGEAGAAKKRVYEALGVDKLRKYVIEPLEPVVLVA